MEQARYVIDCISNDNYYIVTYENGEKFVNIAKKCNTLENVKRLIGVLHISKIIQ